MVITWQKLLLAALILGAALVLWQCDFRGLPTDYRNLPPAATGPWVAFGDSLTAGYGADEGQDYPSRLSERLGVPVVNFGVSGETTAGGLARLDKVAALKPRVVLLGLGGNDTLRRVSPDQTFANLAKMIDRFHEEGSFVVLLGIRSASLRDANQTRFKALAREKKVLYVPDILDGILRKSELMFDYIHPNAAGYERIAERIEEALRPMLPELKGVSSHYNRKSPSPPKWKSLSAALDHAGGPAAGPHLGIGGLAGG